MSYETAGVRLVDETRRRCYSALTKGGSNGRGKGGATIVNRVTKRPLSRMDVNSWLANFESRS